MKVQVKFQFVTVCNVAQFLITAGLCVDQWRSGNSHALAFAFLGWALARQQNPFGNKTHMALVLADGSGARPGGTPTIPRPGQKTKAEMDQERITVALEQIMRELHAINENLAALTK
jgi:hypothetical protein